jgi:hypothetical protein
MKGCNVQIIQEHRICGESPCRPFRAGCACGHFIEGDACYPCLMAVTPGCNTCWGDGSGHVCAVTFEPGDCWCGCGNEVPLARKTEGRYGRRKGRPVRYLPGHNNRDREQAELIGVIA